MSQTLCACVYVCVCVWIPGAVHGTKRLSQGCVRGYATAPYVVSTAEVTVQLMHPYDLQCQCSRSLQCHYSCRSSMICQCQYVLNYQQSCSVKYRCSVWTSAASAAPTPQVM
eukprot:scaffold50595_cov21-Tisochrysis_lutea.AAC.2